MRRYGSATGHGIVVGLAALVVALTAVTQAAVGAVTAPSNDMFADAKVITGRNLNVAQWNTGATSEPGEPNHGGIMGGATVWYSWTAPANGETWIYSLNHDDHDYFDHAVAVYTGSSVTTLTPIVSGGPGDDFEFSFSALKGRVYKIAVVPVGDGKGYHSLDLDMVPANDDFAQPRAITGAAGRLFANNNRSSVEPGEPDHAGVPSSNSTWYAWTAPSSGPVRFNTHRSTFGTVLAAYTGSTLGGLTQVSANDDCADASFTSCVAFDAQGGVTYRLSVSDAAGPIVLNWSFGGCTKSGTNGNDTLSGTSGVDRICGLGGNDTLKGLGGNDILIGGAGDDSLLLGGGNDSALGGIGVDKVTFASPVTVDLLQGAADGEGADEIQEVENVIGSSGADTIYGSLAVNLLRGMAGNDQLYAKGPGDKLYGSDGNDYLVGDTSDTYCDGGPGTDAVSSLYRCGTTVSIER